MGRTALAGLNRCRHEPAVDLAAYGLAHLVAPGVMVRLMCIPNLR